MDNIIEERHLSSYFKTKSTSKYSKLSHSEDLGTCGFTSIFFTLIGFLNHSFQDMRCFLIPHLHAYGTLNHFSIYITSIYSLCQSSIKMLEGIDVNLRILPGTT